jgi:hypothetical protein
MATVVQKPHSCKHCQRLQLNAPLPENDYYEFDFSLTDIFQAAAEDCLFCQWLLSDIGKSAEWQQVVENSDAHDSLKLYSYQCGFNTPSKAEIPWFKLAGPLLDCITFNGFRISTSSGEMIPSSILVFTVCFTCIQQLGRWPNNAR